MRFKRQTGMDPPVARPRTLTERDFERLAAFRLALRRFAAQAEANARTGGLTPQQYQALLSIRGGYPGRQEISIGELAEHLMLKNHSAVELVGRLVKAGLVARAPSPEDRRRICVRITPKGEEMLSHIVRANLGELQVSQQIMKAMLDSQPD
jgi:DNA-binding MarR family transcriptional regulator